MQSLLALGRRMDREPAFTRMLARDLLRVRDRSGRLGPLAPNPAQRLFEARRGQHNIVLKARQMGVTTWIAARFFLRTITYRGTLSVQVAHTRPAAESILAVVERMWANLPCAMREGPLRRSRANAGQMVFPELDSEFRVVSAGEESAGRGLTIQNLHCSEVSRWPGDAAATLAGLRAALAPDGELVLESTPAGAYGAFYDEWMQAPETGIVRHFFPWWLETAYVSSTAIEMTGEELELVRLRGLSAEQIGFRRELAQRFRGLRVQEFAEDAVSCFKASGDCCFEIESIERRLRQIAPPMTRRRNGALEIWLPPLGGREYLVAVDTAGGGSAGDYAAIQVIELGTGLQCAELRERVGVLELARVAASLAREYHGAMIAVERNNHGSGVLAYLDATERYRRLYEQDGVPGWLTNASTKPRMVSLLGTLLEQSANLFQSRRLLEECRTFVNHGNGRTGAAQGAHDDCLMAMAVAQSVRAERLGRS